MVAILLVLIGLASHVVWNQTLPGPAQMGSSLLSGIAVLLLYPAVHDNLKFCRRGSLIYAIIAFVVAWLPLAPAALALIDSVAVAGMLFYYILHRFTNPKSLIGNTLVWHNIEDCERLILSLFYFCLVASFMFVSTRPPWAQWTVSGIIAAAFILMYCYVSRNWSLFFSADRQKLLQRQLRGRVIPAAPLRTDDEMNRISILYDKLCRLMEEKEPYLDPELKISDLSTMLFTNKVYLSRTINVMSGLNFNQYINSFRVEYAKNLMKKDPRLQVQEVAILAGFQTAASLNMAFKLFQGVTPGRYGKSIT